MMPAAKSTLDAIAVEVARARRLHPGNAKLLAALMEGVGELATAMLKNEGPARVRAEAIQVACVAVRLIEEGDLDFADPSTWDVASERKN